MKIILLNILLTLLNPNCSANGQITDKTESIAENDLLFKSTIGPEKLKTIVLIYDKGILSNGKKLLIELKKENNYCTIFWTPCKNAKHF